PVTVPAASAELTKPKPMKTSSTTIRRSCGYLADCRRRCRGERPFLGITREQLTPARFLAPAVEDRAIAHRPPVIVVIDLGAENEHIHDGRVEEELLEGLHWAEPHEVADHRSTVVPHLEAPALVRRRHVAHDLDVRRRPNSELVLV